MKFSFNRKIVNGPWGGGNLFVKSMTEYLISMGHKVSFELEDNIEYNRLFAQSNILCV